MKPLEPMDEWVAWRPIREFKKSPQNKKTFLFGWFKDSKIRPAYKAWGFYDHDHSDSKKFSVVVGTMFEENPSHFMDIDQFDL